MAFNLRRLVSVNAGSARSLSSLIRNSSKTQVQHPVMESSKEQLPESGSNVVQSKQSATEQPLPLPKPSQEIGQGPKSVEVNGDAVKLDHLGPIVVNQDGTLSRISNWAEMSDIERKNTLRILGKRNMLRLQSLKESEAL